MAEFGNISGLAQSLGYDQQVQDLRYRQEALRQQEAKNIAKQALFQDSLEFQKGGNNWDQPIVKAENQKIVQQLGDYISDNPDWETNFQKRGIVKQMKDSLKDNPHVLRAMATNQNREALYKYANEAKSKQGQFDEDELNNQLTRYQNYEKFGNPDGEQAAQSEGMKAYLFTKPQDFVDMNPIYKEAGSSIKNPEIVKTQFGGYYTKPSNADVDARVNSILQSHGRQLMKQAAKQGVFDPKEVKKMVRQNVLSSFDSDFKLGDQLGYMNYALSKKQADLKHAEAAAKVRSGNYSPWDYFTDQTEKGKQAGINPAGTLSVDDFYKVWGSKHPIKAVGTDGSVADLSDFDFKPSGNYINRGGVTFIPGHIDLPLDIAEDKGIYKQGPFTIDGITAPYKGDAEEVKITDKEGNAIPAIRYKYNLPINTKDRVAKQKFNVMVDVDKLVPATQAPQEQQVQEFVDEVGNVFDAQGNFLRKK